MENFGVGIIGYGFIGKVHAYGYHNMRYFYDPLPAGIRMTCVCTSRPETAAAAKAHGGFEHATCDPMEVIARPDVHIVNICTPNHLHRDVLLAAIAADKHIYCDKPLTGEWQDAQAVAAALPGYRGISQMTLNNRFSLVSLRAKLMVQDGFLGHITQFRAGYYHSGSVDAAKPMNWKQEASAGGGVINDLGSHVLDLMDWLIGPFNAVLAESRVLYPARPNRKGEVVPVGAEDAVTVMARLAGGAVGVIEASKIATGTNDELRVEIHGDHGALRFNTLDPNSLEAYDVSDPEAPMGGARGWKRIDTVDRFPAPGGWPGPKFAIGWLRCHVHSLHNFISAVAAGKPTRPSLIDGVRLQRLLEDVRLSARERAWRPLTD